MLGGMFSRLRSSIGIGDSTDVNADEYESDEVNGIYFTAIFFVLIIWNWMLNYSADIGVIAGLIGVSGAYLFLLKAIHTIAHAVFHIDISEAVDMNLQESILKELFISFGLLIMACFTLFAWGSTGSPFPSLLNIVNFFVAYVAGVGIKFAMIRFTHVPIVGIILAGIFLILLGFIFQAQLWA